MCNCMTVCRVLESETEDGKYPIPEHAPCCEDFKQIEFHRISYDGAHCICTPLDAEDFMKDCDDPDSSVDTYVIESVLLTQDQFDNLEEFQGF